MLSENIYIGYIYVVVVVVAGSFKCLNVPRSTHQASSGGAAQRGWLVHICKARSNALAREKLVKGEDCKVRQTAILL